MDIGLIESIGSLGVGALVAAIIAMWKRQDDKEHTAEIARIHEEHAADLKRITDERQTFYREMLARHYEVGEKLTDTLGEVRNGLDKNTAAIGGLATLAEIAEQLRKLTNERRP